MEEWIDEFVRSEYFDSEEAATERLVYVRSLGRRAFKVVMRADFVEVRILPTYQSASVMVKAAGLSSLKEFAAMVGKSENTVRNWWRFEPLLFSVALMGCLQLKERMNEGKGE